ncbi:MULTISPECIES: hypothetical protein [unclassified Acidocella]|uniref:hypothetical protein n=1 Tax=unclassified Acidocella TaxID=2648610 RepID=UPI00028DBA96|nr:MULTISPECIES: hypothetical protein [unclassified Acidocella]EKN01086.1 hypothetical protein MXAZACID_02234 [Acidocella sp. MX-AZ02]WBO60587.1 hypothetical protein GT370_07390 [Acidocella sp. MX-AZ03]
MFNKIASSVQSKMASLLAKKEEARRLRNLRNRRRKSAHTPASPTYMAWRNRDQVDPNSRPAMRRSGRLRSGERLPEVTP